ncbi:MAG: oxidoreductase [Gemmatales bacterium]|nr:MAG: oxidoreductase [Gemmatales bacterium]
MSESRYKVVGTCPIRHDVTDKVTGRALYGADLQLPGTLFGKILRSPFAHANIKKIDASKALAMPGVLAVVTGEDLPEAGDRVAELGEGNIILRYLGRNCLAKEKALYKGHAIAAVAATSSHVAEEALKKIDVQFEPLPPVLDVREAMKPDAPLLHEKIITQTIGAPPTVKSNTARHIQHKLGDPDKGFAQAKVIVEREFKTATVHQGYIEPQNCTAFWNADGFLTVWTSTQGAFSARNQLSELLRLPVSRIKVVPMEIGGGFGGKIRVYLEPVAALLSKKTGRPVKVVMSRSEVFQGTGPTPASYIRVKMGADSSGRLTAAQAFLAYEAGAFPGSPVGPGCMCVFACYDIPNVQIDGYDVVVNKPATSAYRAPGATNAAFATETVIDEICERLNIDPLDFRIRNGARQGTRRGDGLVYPRIGFVECCQKAKEHPHYSAPLERESKQDGSADGPLAEMIHAKPKKYRGRGVASGYWLNAGLRSSASVSVNADGTVNLLEGSTDLAGTRTAVAMQLAEALGLKAEDVRPMVGDTEMIGYTDVTGGSRVTFATGLAAYEAAQQLKKQMCARAAKIWDVSPHDVQYQEDGALILCKSDPTKRFTFKELAAKLNATGGTILASASVAPTGVGPGFATHIVDIEVDPETGKIDILRYTAVQDVGKAIHPAYCEGQIQGGVAQGIGWALHEEYVYNEKGEMLNASFLDYRLPTSLDLPMIDAVLVEVANPGHPYGVRGVGEVPIVPPPAAIANALYRAIGVRMRELPMSPGRVVKEWLAKTTRE